MKIYNFSWGYYEDYVPRILLHSENKSQEQFKSDCIAAMRAVGVKYIEESKPWLSAPDWIKKAIEYLVSNMGYVLPEEISLNVWGDYIIKDKENPDAQEEDSLRFIVGENLYLKASDKNRLLEMEHKNEFLLKHPEYIKTTLEDFPELFEYYPDLKDLVNKTQQKID